MASKTIHFGHALYKVSQLDEAKAFYSKAFEVETYFDEPTWVVFEIGDYQLWLVPADSTEEHPEVYGVVGKPSGITYWQVKNIDAVCQRFTDLGGSVRKTKKNQGPFMEAIVDDPWGNRLGLARPF